MLNFSFYCLFFICRLHLLLGVVNSFYCELINEENNPANYKYKQDCPKCYSVRQHINLSVASLLKDRQRTRLNFLQFKEAINPFVCYEIKSENHLDLVQEKCSVSGEFYIHQLDMCYQLKCVKEAP